VISMPDSHASMESNIAFSSVRSEAIRTVMAAVPEPPVLPKPPPLPAGLRVPTPLPAPAAPDSNRLPNSTAKALRLPEVDVDPLPSLQQISLRSESRPHSERASEAAALQRRESLRVPAEFELTFVEDSYFISGLTQDISEGGLFVATYRLLPIGTPLSLSFQLPSGKRLDVKGVVRWVREEALGDARPGLGIAFSDLSEDALASIAECCAVRPPLVFDM